MSAEFDHFDVNGAPTNLNPATVVMDKDITVTAVYNLMGTVNISGSVTKQSAAGELVTIVITKPDTTKVTVTANTLADLTYKATFAGPAGAYSLIASVAADGTYAAAASPSTPFTIALEARAITVNVAPA